MRFWLFAGLTAATAGCSDYGYGDPPSDTDDTGSTTTPSSPLEPVADAGDDRSVQPLDELVLDAGASSDPAGLPIIGYRWTLVKFPEGSRSEIGSPNLASPTFFVDLAGVYEFELTVENEAGLWDSTPDTLVVTALPADGFYVELSWAASSDLDIHMLNGTTPLFGDGDCSFCNMTPSWGAPTDADDPSLDWDAIFGFGPETITIDEPGYGSFSIDVHYYGEDGLERCRGSCEPSPATVNVYLGGELEASFQRTLTAQGDLWHVATITWPSREIVEVDELGHTNKTACP